MKSVPGTEMVLRQNKRVNVFVICIKRDKISLADVQDAVGALARLAKCKADDVSIEPLGTCIELHVRKDRDTGVVEGEIDDGND